MSLKKGVFPIGLLVCLAGMYSTGVSAASTKLSCDVIVGHVVGDYAPKESRITVQVVIEVNNGSTAIYSIDSRLPFRFDSNQSSARAVISPDEYLIVYKEGSSKEEDGMIKGFVSIDRVTGKFGMVKYAENVTTGANGDCRKIARSTPQF